VTHERTASRFDKRVIHVPRFTYRCDLAVHRQGGESRRVQSEARVQASSGGIGMKSRRIRVGASRGATLRERFSARRVRVSEDRGRRRETITRSEPRNPLPEEAEEKRRGERRKKQAGRTGARLMLDLYSRRKGKVAACADRSNSSCSPPLAARSLLFAAPIDAPDCDSRRLFLFLFRRLPCSARRPRFLSPRCRVYARTRSAHGEAHGAKCSLLHPPPPLSPSAAICRGRS